MFTHFRVGRVACLGAAVAALTLSAASSKAIVILDFNTVITGDLPSGSAPWGTLKIEDNGVNRVMLTLTHNMTSTPGQFFGRLEMFMSPHPADLAAVTPLDPHVEGISFGTGNDAGYQYNVKFDFVNSNAGGLRIVPGIVAVMEITGTGINENSFVTMPGPTSIHGLLHLQGIPGGGSAKLGDVVPEPATMMVFGAGLLALLARRRK
jgi:hypothetical protein